MILNKTLSILLIFFIADLWVFTQFSLANETQRREYIIKTSFILKFPAFINWPVENSPMNLCVPSDDPYKNIWKILEKNTANLVPFNFYDLKNYSDHGNCHILFISGKKGQIIERLVSMVRGKPVLIIGDSSGNLEKGVGINFLVVDNRVRFEINRKSLRAKNLKVSSELLGLAYRVVE